MFEAFRQTETGRNSQQGTGLGLAISQKFVQLMGGKITVSSTLGRGTIFQFDVQLALAEAAEIQVQQPNKRVIGLAPDQPQYRILVVDDQWSNRLLLVKLLEPLGFEVREAENGRDAIAVWSSWSPHLIWMDLRMPVMDGYEATKYIKAHPKDKTTVIIALTASAFEQERGMALSAGCDDFVRKPFREAVIWEKMAEYLGVRYVYAQKDEVEGRSRKDEKTTSDFRLQSSDFIVMPAEWVAQLHQAAALAKTKPIFKLIEQIPETHASLAKALADLVNDFRFDLIIELTQGAIEP